MNARKVYTYRMPDQRKPGGLAMNCHVRNGYLCFFDTIRGHMFEGTVTNDTPDGFVFQAEEFIPGPWEFRVLTIEDFRRQVYRIVEDGGVIAKAIQTTEDLHEWYRKRFGDEAGLNYPDVLEE